MSSQDLDNENELLTQIANGDETAFRMLYDRYRKKIASFAYLLTESADIADEIVQEVFVKTWENRKKLTDVVHFNAWIHTVTRNLVINAMKSLAREKRVRATWAESSGPGESYADEIIFARENEKLLHEAVSRLSPQQQQVYKLSREAGLKNDEIASKLGISALTVKNHLVAAMRSIREYFRSHASLVMFLSFLYDQS